MTTEHAVIAFAAWFDLCVHISGPSSGLMLAAHNRKGEHIRTNTLGINIPTNIVHQMATD